MGLLINEYLTTKEFKKRSLTRSPEWQTRRTNVVLSFLEYAEFRNIKRLKDINENTYSAYINQLHRSTRSKSTIRQYKNILKQDLLSHFHNL
jgi:hypothetical protein